MAVEEDDGAITTTTNEIVLIADAGTTVVPVIPDTPEDQLDRHAQGLRSIVEWGKLDDSKGEPAPLSNDETLTFYPDPDIPAPSTIAIDNVDYQILDQQSSSLLMDPSASGHDKTIAGLSTVAEE
jgi:hypothetical protein